MIQNASEGSADGKKKKKKASGGTGKMGTSGASGAKSAGTSGTANTGGASANKTSGAASASGASAGKTQTANTTAKIAPAPTAAQTAQAAVQAGTALEGGLPAGLPGTGKGLPTSVGGASGAGTLTVRSASAPVRAAHSAARTTGAPSGNRTSSGTGRTSSGKGKTAAKPAAPRPVTAYLPSNQPNNGMNGGRFNPLDPVLAGYGAAQAPDETIYTPESDPTHWMRNAQGAATPNPSSFEDGAYWRAYAEEQQRLAQERKQEEYAAQVKQAEDALSWEQMQNIRRAVYAKMEYDSETMPVDEAARSAWMAEGRDITERYIHAKALLEELELPPALLTALEQEYNATVRRTSTQQEAEAAAEQHPILASGLTVANNLASGVLGGVDLAWQNARNNLGLGAGIGNWLDSRAKAAQSGAITATGSPAQETATPETPLSQQPKGEAPKSFAQRMSDWLDSRAEAAQAGEITATGDPTYIESELTPDELRWPWQIALGQKLADDAQTGAGAVGEAIGTLISGERFYNVWSNFGDILFNNIVAGLTDTGDDLASTAEAILPDSMKKEVLGGFLQSVHDANDIWTQKAQDVNEAAEVENIGALLQMFGSMIPAMIVSKLKAAPSAGGTPTPGSQAGKTAAASDVLQQLTKDPNFWLDMATEFGPSYKQAAQNGMDDWLAYLYAAARGMTSGLMEDLDLPELASEVLP